MFSLVTPHFFPVETVNTASDSDLSLSGRDQDWVSDAKKVRTLHARQSVRSAKPAAAVLAATTFSACTGRSESRATETPKMVDSDIGNDTIGLLGLLGVSSVMLWAGVKLMGYSIRGVQDDLKTAPPSEKLSKVDSPTAANLPPGLHFKSPVEMITQTESGITAVNRYEEQGPAATVEIVDEDEETAAEGICVEEPEMENVFVLRPPVQEMKKSFHRRLMLFMVGPGFNFENAAEVLAMENLSYEETVRRVDILTDLRPDIAEKVVLAIVYLCHRSNIGLTKVPYVSPQIFDLACELAKLPNQQFSDLFLQERFLLGRPGGRFLLEARSNDEGRIIRMLQHLIIFYKKCQYFNLDSAFMAKVTEKLRYIYDDATFFAGVNRRIDEAFRYSLGNMHDTRLLLARYPDYVILGEGESPFDDMPNDDY